MFHLRKTVQETSSLILRPLIECFSVATSIRLIEKHVISGFILTCHSVLWNKNIMSSKWQKHATLTKRHTAVEVMRVNECHGAVKHFLNRAWSYQIQTQSRSHCKYTLQCHYSHVLQSDWYLILISAGNKVIFMLMVLWSRPQCEDRVRSVRRSVLIA